CSGKTTRVVGEDRGAGGFEHGVGKNRQWPADYARSARSRRCVLLCEWPGELGWQSEWPVPPRCCANRVYARKISPLNRGRVERICSPVFQGVSSDARERNERVDLLRNPSFPHQK